MGVVSASESQSAFRIVGELSPSMRKRRSRVSGSFLARFGSRLGSRSALGAGPRVGLGVRPYLDRHQNDAIREQPTSVKILANVL